MYLSKSEILVKYSGNGLYPFWWPNFLEVIKQGIQNELEGNAREKYEAQFGRQPEERWKKILKKKQDKSEIPYHIPLKPRVRLFRGPGLKLYAFMKNYRKIPNPSKKVLPMDYSIEQLRGHLQSQFREGMTWDNYGPVWHIDHKRPLSWFDIKEVGDGEFMKCWDLSNLQPLFAEENIRKRNRWSDE